MPINPPFPPTSSTKVSTSQPLIDCSNHLFNRSKGVRDYKQRMRVEFPGGWNHEGDPIIQWYHLQPHRLFRSIEYRKEREGVRHEYVLVLLQDGDENRTDSYCRLERVADPVHRMEAIGVNGTTAFDFIQTIDRNDPNCASQVHDDSKSELVAQITFPRVFDLSDILAICYGIHSHPKAKRYTLQQFNCYFFSWTTVLCLARRAVNWEGTLRNNTNQFEDAVVKHVEDIRSSGKYTAWSLVFRIHDRSHTHTQPNVIERFLSEISNNDFLDAVDGMLYPLLWHDQDPNHFRLNLANRLLSAADEAVDPILDDLMIQDEPTGRDWSPPDLARICVIVWHKGQHNAQAVQVQIQANKHYYLESAKRAPLKDQVKILGVWTQKHLEQLNPRHLVYALGHCANLSWDIYDRNKATLCGERWGHLQGPLSVTKAILSFPKAFYSSLVHEMRAARLSCHSSIAYYIRDNQLDIHTVPYLPRSNYSEACVHALNESIRIYCARYPLKDTGSLRYEVVKAIQYFYAQGYIDCQNVLGNGNMAQLWKVSLRMDLGGVISQAILDNIVRPRSGAERQLKLITENTVGGEAECVPEPRYISHTEIQGIVRERISRLSKREVDHAPIAQYVLRLPFTTPPQQSKKEIEDVIQEIWGSCGPLMT